MSQLKHQLQSEQIFGSKEVGTYHLCAFPYSLRCGRHGSREHLASLQTQIQSLEALVRQSVPVIQPRSEAPHGVEQCESGSVPTTIVGTNAHNNNLQPDDALVLAEKPISIPGDVVFSAQDRDGHNAWQFPSEVGIQYVFVAAITTTRK